MSGGGGRGGGGDGGDRGGRRCRRGGGEGVPVGKVHVSSDSDGFEIFHQAKHSFLQSCQLLHECLIIICLKEIESR